MEFERFVERTNVRLAKLEIEPSREEHIANELKSLHTRVSNMEKEVAKLRGKVEGVASLINGKGANAENPQATDPGESRQVPPIAKGEGSLPHIGGTDAHI
jgi:tRNA C32,U32 (ribose-2'-O)-methylase TrmJ